MQRIGKFLASAAFMLPLSGKISAEPVFFSVGKNHEEKFHADFLLNFKQAEMPMAKSVVLDIQRVEVLLHKGKTMGRLRLLEGLGPVDVMNLGAALQLKLAELNIPDDVRLSQVRFVLKDGGHSLTKKTGQKCSLQLTGTDQNYVQVNKAVHFKAGISYYMDVSMDLTNQILVNKNGGCYLRPSLRLASQLESLPIGEQRGGIVIGKVDRTSERSPASELILAQWKDIFSQDIESTFGDGVY